MSLNLFSRKRVAYKINRFCMRSLLVNICREKQLLVTHFYTMICSLIKSITTFFKETSSLTAFFIRLELALWPKCISFFFRNRKYYNFVVNTLTTYSRIRSQTLGKNGSGSRRKRLVTLQKMFLFFHF